MLPVFDLVKRIRKKSFHPCCRVESPHAKNVSAITIMRSDVLVNNAPH